MFLPYITIPKFAEASGYSEDAARSKIRDLVWREGEVWIKAPDGRILISIEGFKLWAEMGQALNRPPIQVLKSVSSIRNSGAAKGFHSSPAPLI